MPSVEHAPQAKRADRKQTESFRPAVPGYGYTFPGDHGSHDAFRTEWWYYTGHLSTEGGRRFGYQLTFFRRGLADVVDQSNPSLWTIRHLYLAHFALTDVEGEEFHFAEKLSRAGLGKAGADSGRLRVWVDRWVAQWDPGDTQGHRIRAEVERFSINLQLRAEKPPISHGKGGISRKGPKAGQASHYYSMTRLTTDGTLTIDDAEYAVTGLSWMDHEFGSADLGQGIVGWDWFSVQLDDRTELMFYLLRREDGTPDTASSGTFVSAAGQTRHLVKEDVELSVLDHWTSPSSNARYPNRWRISIPSLNLSLELSPLLAGQELTTSKSTDVTYWEGAVAVTGQREGTAVRGQGYVELTGYAERFSKRL